MEVVHFLPCSLMVSSHGSFEQLCLKILKEIFLVVNKGFLEGYLYFEKNFVFTGLSISEL